MMGSFLHICTIYLINFAIDLELYIFSSYEIDINLKKFYFKLYFFPLWAYLELDCMMHSCLLNPYIFMVIIIRHVQIQTFDNWSPVFTKRLGNSPKTLNTLSQGTDYPFYRVSIYALPPDKPKLETTLSVLDLIIVELKCGKSEQLSYHNLFIPKAKNQLSFWN